MPCTLFSQCMAHKFHQFPAAVVKDAGSLPFRPLMKQCVWQTVWGKGGGVRGAGWQGCTVSCQLNSINTHLAHKFIDNGSDNMQRRRERRCCDLRHYVQQIVCVMKGNPSPPPSAFLFSSLCVLYSMLQSARVLWQISLTKGGIKKRTLSISQRGKERTGDAERIAAASGVKAFCHIEEVCRSKMPMTMVRNGQHKKLTAHFLSNFLWGSTTDMYVMLMPTARPNELCDEGKVMWGSRWGKKE